MTTPPSVLLKILLPAIVAGIFCSALVLGPTTVSGQPSDPCTFRVVNRGPQDLVRLQIGRDGSEEFSKDLLDGQPVHAGQAQPLTVPRTASYDIRSVFRDGFVLFSRSVDVCANDLVVSHG